MILLSAEFDSSEHLEPALIAAYVDGGLSRAERNQANQHLSICRECMKLLANTIRTVTELRAERDREGR